MLGPGDLDPKRSFFNIREYVDRWGEQTSKERFQFTSTVLICSHACRVREACRTRGQESLRELTSPSSSERVEGWAFQVEGEGGCEQRGQSENKALRELATYVDEGAVHVNTLGWGNCRV